MKIDIDKARADLEEVRRQKDELIQQENRLVAFIDMANGYRASDDTDDPIWLKAERERLRTENEELRQQQKMPRWRDLRRRNIVARAITTAFQPGDIFTAGDLYAKVGNLWDVPPGHHPVHDLSNVVMQERLEGGILNRVSRGKYIIRPDAEQIVQRRLAAETQLE